MSDDEAEDVAASIIEGEVIGTPPTPEALGQLLGMILDKARGSDEENEGPEVVVINMGQRRREPELPKFQTPEEREAEEREASHKAIHSIVDIHMLSHKIGEAANAEDTAAYDQANAEVHHLIGHLPLNRLRNVALIACTMVDREALGAAVVEYCGKTMSEENDDE